MILETERLILRPWREDDAEMLYEYAKDPRVGPAAGWPAHTSVPDSLNILRTVLMKEDTWAVTIKGSDAPVGSVGVFPAEPQECGGAPEIGYWIGVPFWGMGYIPEAVRRLIELCLDERGAAEVWCAHFRGNDKSRRVIEKCGFRYVFTEMTDMRQLGEPRESLFYRISREERKV